MIPVSKLMTVFKSAPYFYETTFFESYEIVPCDESSPVFSSVPKCLAGFIQGVGNASRKETQVNDTSALIKLLQIYENLEQCENIDFGFASDELLSFFKQYGFALSGDENEMPWLYKGNTVAMWWMYGKISLLYSLYSQWVTIHYGKGIAFDTCCSCVEPKEFITSVNHISINRRLFFEGEKPIIHMECVDMYEALNVQMQDIIMQGDAGVSDVTAGATIGYCRECGIPFVKRHGNASLCDYHRRNDVKVSNSRARKKAQRKEQE